MTLRRVLVVEDDPDIRELAVMALEVVGGLEVETCVDGSEAVAAADRYRPDLVVLDWRMPIMDGGETIKALRQNPTTSDIPVVFMTASMQEDEVKNMRQMGAADVIAKPFDPMTLAAHLASVWKSIDSR